jgi:S1-C subfamily serine protease
MSWKVMIVLIGVALGSGVAPPRAAADDPPVVEVRQKFVPWKLGVNGVNTSEGYVISKVREGYPANLLGRDRSSTLERGDRITEIDGQAIDRSWTLQKALGYSSGKIDLQVWDDRAGKYRTFRGVTLVR